MTRSAPGTPDAVTRSQYLRRQVALGALGFVLTGAALTLLSVILGQPEPEGTSPPAAPVAGCNPPCSARQECIDGTCQVPAAEAHLPSLANVGGFTVGRDASDLVVAGERVFVATRGGIEVHSGGLVTVVADARGVTALTRVGDFVYGTRGRTVNVVDIASARMLARMELHGTAGRPVVIGDGSRVLVPVSDRREVAVIYPALHAVLPSVPFDVGIGSVALSTDGTRAIAVSGRTTEVRVRLGFYSMPTGRERAVGSTVFAFDPTRTTFQADHSRIEVGVQPWAAVFVSNDAALLALRGENALVPVRWTDDGFVTGARQQTCESPDLLVNRPGADQIMVRCGRAVALVGQEGTPLASWAMPGEVVDALVSPDGGVAYVAHSVEAEGASATGGITAIDLEARTTSSVDLEAVPTSVALYEDGRTLGILLGARVVLLGAERVVAGEQERATAASIGLTLRATVSVGGRPASVVIGGEPARIFVGTSTGREIVVVDPVDGAIVWRLRAGHAVDEVHLLHGRWLTAHQYWGSQSVSVWDLAAERPEGEPPVRQTLNVGRNIGDLLELGDGESVLITAVQSQTLSRFRLTTMEPTGSVRLPRACGALVPVEVNGRPHAAVMGGIFRANLFTGRATASGAWVDVVDLDAEPFGSRRRALSAGQQPRDPGVTANGTVLLFPDRMSNQVTRVLLESSAPPQTVGVGREPEAVAVLADDERAVSIDAASATVTVMRIDPLQRLGSIQLDHPPHALAVSRAAGFAIVGLTGSGFPGNGRGVVLLGGTPLTILGRADTGLGPLDVAASEDGGLVATANSGDGTVTILAVQR